MTLIETLIFMALMTIVVTQSATLFGDETIKTYKYISNESEIYREVFFNIENI